MAEFQRPNSICHVFGNYLNFFFSFLSFFFFFLKQQWKKPKQIQTWREFLETLCSADACFPPPCQRKPKSRLSWWQFLAFPSRGKKQLLMNCCVRCECFCVCVCVFLLKALFLKRQKIQLHHIHPLKKKAQTHLQMALETIKPTPSGLPFPPFLFPFPFAVKMSPSFPVPPR